MEYNRITLRIPKDLDDRLNDEAEKSSKSKNAEIINRLQASLLEDAGSDLIVTAEEARKLAAQSRANIKQTLLKNAFEDIAKAIRNGSHRAFVGIEELDADEESEAFETEVIGPVTAELEELGYQVENTGTHLFVQF